MSDAHRARDLAELPATSRTVEANGLSHHLLDYGGDGAPLVVLPGITSPAITWDFVARELGSAVRPLVLDLRGRGLSSQPERGYAMTDYAADVAGVVQALGLDRPIVLGHSLGARIGAAFGAATPELAGPLILVDPPLSGPDRGPYATPLEAFERQLREANAGTTADEVARDWPRWPRREQELRARWLPTCSAAAVAETHGRFQTEDFFDDWPALRDVVLIYGGDSPVVTAEGAAELAATNPGAELVAVPGAGHMVPWDEFEGFQTAIQPFLSRFART
jgi:N-formylmaleamate deformylase